MTDVVESVDFENQLLAQNKEIIKLLKAMVLGMEMITDQNFNSLYEAIDED